MPVFRVLLVLLLLATQACSNDTYDGPERSASDPTGVDFTCLQEAIYFEAGNSDPVGQAAVAHVILNRVADARFPSEICSVIREGESKGRCQFSYRCILDPNGIRWPDNHARAGQTAKRVLSGDVADPTDGALYFHSASIAPGWFATLRRTGNFGGNIFYR